MIKRYAVIEDEKVQNVIVWDSENGDISQVTELFVVETEDGDLGDLYIDGQFIKPDEPYIPPGIQHIP